MQLLQFPAGGLELALHLSSTFPVGDSPPHSLCRLFDLQLSLDLLSDLIASIFQALLKLWVQNISLFQIMQIMALTNIAQMILWVISAGLSCLPGVYLKL